MAIGLLSQLHNPTFAQRQRQQRGGGLPENAPKVDSRIPNAKGFDIDGKEVRVRDFVKGKPAVIVFGCMT